MAVPEGFLFRAGSEKALRRYLIERGHLEAVVALPEATDKQTEEWPSPPHAPIRKLSFTSIEGVLEGKM